MFINTKKTSSPDASLPSDSSNTPNFGRMNPPRAFRSHDGLGTWICVSKIFSQMVVVTSGDESHGKTQKKSPLNKPQGMVYISSFGKFPTPWPCFNSFQVCMCPHQSQLLQLPPELETMTNLVFLSFLNIPMEVQKVHMIAHHKKIG